MTATNEAQAQAQAALLALAARCSRCGGDLPLAAGDPVCPACATAHCPYCLLSVRRRCAHLVAAADGHNRVTVWRLGPPVPTLPAPAGPVAWTAEELRAAAGPLAPLLAAIGPQQPWPTTADLLDRACHLRDLPHKLVRQRPDRAAHAQRSYLFLRDPLSGRATLDEMMAGLNERMAPLAGRPPAAAELLVRSLRLPPSARGVMPIHLAAFAPDAETVVAVQQRPEVRLAAWDTRSGVRLWEVLPRAQAHYLTVSPKGVLEYAHGRWSFAESLSNRESHSLLEEYRREVRTGRLVNKVEIDLGLWIDRNGNFIPGVGEAPGLLWPAAVSPDGRLAARVLDRAVFIVAFERPGDALTELRQHDPVVAVAFRPEGTLLSLTATGDLCEWDVAPVTAAVPPPPARPA